MLGSKVVSRLIGRRPRTTSSLPSLSSSSSSSSSWATQITPSGSVVWHHRCSRTTSSDSSLLVLPSTIPTTTTTTTTIPTLNGTTTTTRHTLEYPPLSSTVRPLWRTTRTQTQFINRLYSSSTLSDLPSLLVHQSSSSSSSSGVRTLSQLASIVGDSHDTTTTTTDHWSTVSGGGARDPNRGRSSSTSQTNTSEEEDGVTDELFRSVMEKVRHRASLTERERRGDRTESRRCGSSRSRRPEPGTGWADPHHRAFSSSPSNHNNHNHHTPKPPPVEPTPTTTTITLTPKPTTTKARTKLKPEKTLTTKATKALESALNSLTSLLLKTPGVLWFYLTHPTEFRAKLVALKDAAKKEAHHYYMGSKLLLADIRTAKQMLSTTLSGTPLTRRERKQLLRTVSDVFRIIPMSVFVLIPFMEFALPFALKLFPNMLPSTFQDSLRGEETMKRELKSRIAMAEFFQETLQDMAKEQKKTAARRKKAIMEQNDENPSSDLKCTESQEQSAASFLEFIEKARKGEMFPPEVIIKFATYFKDDLTLDNMPRMQLINMCKYMSIPPYGNNNLLRLQLRHRIRVLQEDDQKIVWEGITSLTKMELREACQERGMRSTGLSKGAYKRSLQQWIDLSVNRNVPVSLLIMSRTFFLQEEMTSQISPDTDGTKSVAGLADAISGLDKEVVNEVILESATAEEKRSDPALLQLKLEVLEQQNELIEEENKQREAEAAKRAEKEQQIILENAIEKAQIEADIAAATIAMEEAKFEMGSSSDIQFSDPSTFVDNADSTKKDVDDTNILHDDVTPPHKKEPAIISAIEILQGDTKKTEEDKDRPLTSSFTELEMIASYTTMDRDGHEEEQSDDEAQLSSEEIDAISELVSPDPVSAEREKLERLKAAMVVDDEEATVVDNGEAMVVDDGEGEYRMAGTEHEGIVKDASISSAKSSLIGADTFDNQPDQPAFVETVHANEKTVGGLDDDGTTVSSPVETLSSEEADSKAVEIIDSEERRAADEAEASTQISMYGDLSSGGVVEEKTPVYSTEGVLLSEDIDDHKAQISLEEDVEEERVVEDDSVYQDEKLDKAIAGLKTKVESMVDNIEVQLTDVEAKIGDKLHFLDKDMDGILSREEMADCLQKVLKRTLTLEESMAIAIDMDVNQDGHFSVEELSRWLETNKLVKLVEEGDHAEVDNMIAAKAAKVNADYISEKQERPSEK